MDLAGVFKESIDVSKKNIVIFIPEVVAMAAAAMLSLIVLGSGAASMGLMGVGGGAMKPPEAMIGAMASFARAAFIVAVIGGLMSIFAHAMTVAMANEAIEKGATSIGGGLSRALGRFGQILAAAIIVGIAVGIGLMLLIIPGIIAAFILMFTFVAIMLDGMGAIEAMKKSFSIVKTNLSETIVFFIVIVAVAIVFGIANVVLAFIPVVGQILGMVLMGVFYGYISVVMVKAYRALRAPAEEAQSPAGPTQA